MRLVLGFPLTYLYNSDLFTRETGTLPIIQDAISLFYSQKQL